ncbi:MAG TPA: hypothetical protein VE262_22100 [Blastocatellia bacterium]|nr:hypothetical protein [Blastocatellia bacterium]
MFERDEGLRQTREKVRGMSDEELVQMATSDEGQYREESVDFAIAELTRRGFHLEAYDSKDELSSGVGAGNGVRVEIFRGAYASWEELFAEAARFATEIGRENLINISHSEDGSEGVVVVWYWSPERGHDS